MQGRGHTGSDRVIATSQSMPSISDGSRRHVLATSVMPGLQCAAGKSQGAGKEGTMSKTLFGVHTGPQNCTLEELRQIWRLADRSGFHWVSIWDHFYPAMLVPSDVQGSCFEAVWIMTALAAETRHVRVGSLEYCMAYRHPAGHGKAMGT